MRNRQLLIFSYDYPPSSGGIARLCQEIASGMHKYYKSVKVLTVSKNGISVPYNYHQVDIVKLPSKRFLCELAAWWYLLKIKNKNNTDVLCGLWHPEAFLCILSGINNVFVLAHGAEYLYGTSKFRKQFWLPIYCRFVLSRIKKIIANSHYTEKLVMNINSNARSVALPLAVNHSFFRPLAIEKDTVKLKICTVSRVLRFKGHDFIMQTIAKLPQVIKMQIEWHIAGTGVYLPDLKEQVKELGVEKQIFFHGFVSDENLSDFYNAADVFILCTRESTNSTQVEGFGLVFLEAQSCGIPVIGTNTGGIPDAVEDGNGGWLIKQDSQDELASLLIEMVKNRDVVIQMGKKARLRVEKKCTWQKYCKDLNNLME